MILRLNPPKAIRPRLGLPGDTPALVDALHALNRAGLLPANTSSRWRLPCPRCGRWTAVTQQQHDDYWPPASVCGRCRAEWISDHPDWAAKWDW